MINVRLNEIIEIIQNSADGGEYLLNLKTGQILFISEELMIKMEEDDELYSEFKENDICVAQDYLDNPDDYLLLPTQQEINEEQIKQDFVDGLDKKIARHLLVGLKEQAAFRHFKDKLIFLGIEWRWNQFRDERYKKFLLKWCQENDLGFE